MMILQKKKMSVLHEVNCMSQCHNSSRNINVLFCKKMKMRRFLPPKYFSHLYQLCNEMVLNSHKTLDQYCMMDLDFFELFAGGKNGL